MYADEGIGVKFCACESRCQGRPYEVPDPMDPKLQAAMSCLSAPQEE